jgi:predicted RNA-binding Zn-ribbon protein involved in translation (DUF1610 family)
MTDQRSDLQVMLCPVCGTEQISLVPAWAKEQEESFDYDCEGCGAKLGVTVYLVPLFDLKPKADQRSPDQSSEAAQ